MSLATLQAEQLRKPTFEMWIEGLGDVTDRIEVIDTSGAILGARFPSFNIGTGTIVADNDEGFFYDDGKSKIVHKAKVKIWVGFEKTHTALFSGVIRNTNPIPDTERVVLDCADYMWLYDQDIVSGSQDPNFTPKAIIEAWNDALILQDNIPSGSEYTTTLTQPKFERQSQRSALEELANSVFSVAYFDEDGVMQLREREYKNATTIKFDTDNVTSLRVLTDTPVINDMTIEYRSEFVARHSNQASIDQYGSRSQYLRTWILNSTLFASKVRGYTEEALDNSLEGFKFTTDSAGYIDCVRVALGTDGATGYITLKIYSDSGGSPSVLLGTSQSKPSNDFFIYPIWEVFYFSSPVKVSDATDYWGILDTSGVTGTVNARISRAAASGKHAVGSWATEDNKWILHQVRGSGQAQRASEDWVRFHKDPNDRIAIETSGMPQLKRFDEVLVDVTTETHSVKGYYVVESRRNILTSDTNNYKSIFILREAA